MLTIRQFESGIPQSVSSWAKSMSDNPANRREKIRTASVDPAQRLGLDDLGNPPSLEADPGPLVTVADRVETSTSQFSESPGSNPNTVATDCGTVVLRDSDRGAARNTRDSNSRGMGDSRRAITLRLLDHGLTRGRRIDLILKYHRQYRSIDRPMNGTRGPWDETVEQRAIKLVSAHREAVRPAGRIRFSVASFDGTKSFEVAVDPDGWSCTCESWQDRQTPCAEIVAVAKYLDPNPPPILEEATRIARPIGPKRNFRAIDNARQNEHPYFDDYLWDILGSLSERVCETGRRGRPAIPLRVQALMSIRKVHLKEDSRDARGLLVALNRDGKGILPRVPNYAVPSRFFNRPQAPGILSGLVELTGLALKGIEDQGTVAIDSSGFSTSTMGSYFTERYEPTRRHQFVKVHAAVGVKTHIVVSAKVTDEHGGDCPQFAPLLTRVRELGHTFAMVVADKAYLSRENLTIADQLDFDPYIPFKSNNRGLAKGSPMWNRKFHEFMGLRPEFDECYHQRSNVEATFSAIKRKLGETLLSKTTEARISELLAKVVAYNIGVVIYQAELHGLPLGRFGFRASSPPGVPRSSPPELPPGGEIAA